jgi:hypothetical protein
VLTASGKLYDGGRVIVIHRIVAQPFVVLETDSLDQEMPQVVMLKVAGIIGVDSGAVQDGAQDVVLLEPGPEHREVVNDVWIGDAIRARARIAGHGFQKGNNLALARGRTPYQDKNIKRQLAHSRFASDHNDGGALLGGD